LAWLYAKLAISYGDGSGVYIATGMRDNAPLLPVSGRARANFPVHKEVAAGAPGQRSLFSCLGNVRAVAALLLCVAFLFSGEICRVQNGLNP
jgi:hypothetical protein